MCTSWLLAFVGVNELSSKWPLLDDAMGKMRAYRSLVGNLVILLFQPQFSLFISIVFPQGNQEQCLYIFILYIRINFIS